MDRRPPVIASMPPAPETPMLTAVRIDPVPAALQASAGQNFASIAVLRARQSGLAGQGRSKVAAQIGTNSLRKMMTGVATSSSARGCSSLIFGKFSPNSCLHCLFFVSSLLHI